LQHRHLVCRLCRSPSGDAISMQVGCLGRPLRPPRWTSRRTKWRNVITTCEVSAVLIAVLVASNAGIDHLRRPPANGDTADSGVEAIAGTPAADGTFAAETSQQRTGVSEDPRPANIAPSVKAKLSAPPGLKHMRTRLRSALESRRPHVIAQAGPANVNGVPRGAAAHKR
jgi:hypothetical protein